MDRGKEGGGVAFRGRRTGTLVAALLVGAALLSGCRGAAASRVVPGGNPDAGKVAIQAYGCGSCHTVPGVRGAHGLVAPPLTSFASRSFIAGEVPNTTGNLIRWIQNPQSIEPGTAMPNLGVTRDVARDIAAYLYLSRQR
jgi:cytochrome c